MKIVYKKSVPESQETIKAVLADVEILKEINHPNILTLYEFAENPRSYQIVM